jgi:hypothetical protein
MNRKILSFFLIVGILGMISCKKNNYPDEPVLEFKSQSKNTMKQNGQDSMILVFNYTDGDGDVGNDSIDNIFLLDKRTEQILASYRFPNDTDTEVGEYRKGELQLIVYSGCCIYNDTSFATCTANPNQSLDTMRYIIEVKDRSGKMSNRIESEDLILECN